MIMSYEQFINMAKGDFSKEFYISEEENNYLRIGNSSSNLSMYARYCN
jgi:hypothetical protein